MKFVLLDVDDTLFDFVESAKSALKKCWAIENMEYSDYFIERFIALDRILWHKYEIGEETFIYSKMYDVSKDRCWPKG